MKILAIETSCDETAIALLEHKGKSTSSIITILGEAILTQTKLHEQYGGVYPMMAKREHARVLAPLLEKVLKEAQIFQEGRVTSYELGVKNKIKQILNREGELGIELLKLLEKIEKPKIDCLAVTNGPGLEPALWVGINFAKAISIAWGIPVIPINHMEGHIFSAFFRKKTEKQFTINNLQYPVLSLLISGGHTELVLSPKKDRYKVIGKTRDDAAGEAFDKVARMLNLPYPGGPQISELVKKGSVNERIKLPRPMLYSPDFDFSFAGLKTAVLYLLKKIGTLNDKLKADIALEFEKAVTEVLIYKTMKAIKKFNIKTLILGGGVSANERIRLEFAEIIKKETPEVRLYLPEKNLTTDNAVMIALAAFPKFKKGKKYSHNFKADGNLKF